MQRNIVELPCGLFGPLMSDWILNVRGRAASDGVDGSGQVIYGNQPRWEATLDLSGFGRDRVLTWRAIRAKLRGRVNVLRVCMCDRWRPKYSELGYTAETIAAIRGHGVPHSDGTYHSDGTGYATTPTVRPYFDAEPGDETIRVNATSINDALQPGQWFSHNDWPYQVTGMSGTMSSRTYTFEPPLRRAIPAGAELYIEASGLFALVDDMQGRMPLIYGKHGETQIQLVEWVNRP